MIHLHFTGCACAESPSCGPGTARRGVTSYTYMHTQLSRVNYPRVGMKGKWLASFFPRCSRSACVVVMFVRLFRIFILREIESQQISLARACLKISFPCLVCFFYLKIASTEDYAIYTCTRITGSQGMSSLCDMMLIRIWEDPTHSMITGCQCVRLYLRQYSRSLLLVRSTTRVHSLLFFCASSCNFAADEGFVYGLLLIILVHPFFLVHTTAAALLQYAVIESYPRLHGISSSSKISGFYNNSNKNNNNSSSSTCYKFAGGVHPAQGWRTTTITTTASSHHFHNLTGGGMV